MLPATHHHVTGWLDPAARLMGFLRRWAYTKGIPGIHPHYPCPRPIPDHLVSFAYRSFRPVPNSAGIDISPNLRFDEDGNVCKASQVPALRIYSSDYALALRGRYGYDYRVTSLHFRLRYSGVPYADCPSIPFLAPDWQLPYVWSTYPHLIERYPYWIFSQPENSLEATFVQEQMKHHGHISGGQERRYKRWDFAAAEGKAWAAGGREGSIKEMIHHRMVPDLNYALDSDDTAKDLAAIKIIEQLNWLVVSIPTRKLCSLMSVC